MADKTAIEWTDASWTPIRARNLKTGKVGWHCEHATTGCEFCYAEGFNQRLGTGLSFKPGHRADIEIFLDETMLTQPLRWKRPRKIFVCSMTDLFASFVTDEMIDKVFAVMALCPQHTFQVLTKRAERMRDYFSKVRDEGGLCDSMGIIWQRAVELATERSLIANYQPQLRVLPNVWLGVSAERQQEADERIPLLLETPAAVRFVSLEPLLGAIDLRLLRSHDYRSAGAGQVRRGFNALTGSDCTLEESGRYTDWGRDFRGRDADHPDFRSTKLDWVIVGGESGPHARPMHFSWARSIVDQCRTVGVACFAKQMGAQPVDDLGFSEIAHDVRFADRKGGNWNEWPESLRVRQFPEPRP